MAELREATEQLRLSLYANTDEETRAQMKQFWDEEFNAISEEATIERGLEWMRAELKLWMERDTIFAVPYNLMTTVIVTDAKTLELILSILQTVATRRVTLTLDSLSIQFNLMDENSEICTKLSSA
uniref:Uncharacterized protein n=1 Tax=Oryza nivara TaxID=4536 RepID=A0A0E0IVR2_ORYNI